MQVITEFLCHGFLDLAEFKPRSYARDVEDGTRSPFYSFSIVLRAFRIKAIERRLTVTASPLKRPCRQAPLALPFGAPPFAP